MNKLAQKYQGFTLVELLITMIIITILSSAFIPNFLDLSRQRADLVVAEMWAITQAVQNYEAQEGRFPGAENGGCTNTITVLSSETFIAGVSTETGETPWGGGARYNTKCDSTTANLLELSINNINKDWGAYIANSLPAATYTADDAGITIVTINIPKLAYIPVLERFLYLDQNATSTSSPSGTYHAKGDILVASTTYDIILMGRNTSTSTINSTASTITSLSRAVFYQEMAAITSSTPITITKPTCATPTIAYALSGINFGTRQITVTTTINITAQTIDVTTQTINGATPTIDVPAQTINGATTISFIPASWDIKLEDTDTMSPWTLSIESTPTANATVLISTKCQ